jgi:chemotaxis protein CheZ
MTCAEAVMGADANDQAGYKALVDEKMMVIFEACSFQDITGQRIAKVVETLQHIEQRVARFAEVMKASDFTGYMTDEERTRAARKEKNLLNGPQLAGEGIDQAFVDDMFAPTAPR